MDKKKSKSFKPTKKDYELEAKRDRALEKQKPDMRDSNLSKMKGKC